MGISCVRCVISNMYSMAQIGRTIKSILCCTHSIHIIVRHTWGPYDQICYICTMLHTLYSQYCKVDIGAVWSNLLSTLCRTHSVPNTVRQTWGPYDQRLYSQCPKQFWVAGGVTHTTMPTLRANNEKKKRKTAIKKGGSGIKLCHYYEVHQWYLLGRGTK